MRHKNMGIAAAIMAASMLGFAPAATAGPSVQAAPAASCATVYWGSLPKTAVKHTSSLVDNVRTGRHDCFDRMVVDLTGDPASYTVQYVNNVYQLGSGKKVALKGGAILSISVNAAAYKNGKPTYTPVSNVQTLNYSTFKQLGWLGSFEAQSAWGLSTRAKLPMRAIVLDGPGNGSRLVIDVAHHW